MSGILHVPGVAAADKGLLELPRGIVTMTTDPDNSGQPEDSEEQWAESVTDISSVKPVRLTADQQRQCQSAWLDHEGAMWRYAMALARDTDEANEVVQTAWLSAMRSATFLRLLDEDRPVIGYLITIVRHAAFNRTRQARVRPLPTDPTVLTERHQQLQEDSTQTIDAMPALSQALKRLSPYSQTLLVLRLIEQKSYEEIAGMLGRTPATIRVAYARALTQLRDAYRKLTEED